MLKGIDISSWQGLPKWDKIKQSGIDFTILRCHDKYGVDKSFEHNYNGAVSNGIPVGVYKYSYATNEAEALNEAKNVIETIKGKKLDLPVFYDLEWEPQFEYGKNKLESIATTFLKAVENAGFRVGIYCNTYWYNNVLSNKLKKYPLWIAVVPATKNDNGEIKESLRPTYASMWQYSWNGHISGIDGSVDMNVIQDDELLSISNDSRKEEVDSLTIADAATRWMEALAKDPSHGYDQIYRWGEKGDYDCSSATITAWRTAGIPLTCTYTGNMRKDMINNGFVDVTNQIDLSTGLGLIRGDVLLNEVHHVAMYCGDGLEVEASINEMGTATGGQPGDQTGREVLIRNFRNYPWDVILRYTGKARPYLFKGCVGERVKELQEALNKLVAANLDVDGDFGKLTDAAVKTFQANVGLDADGIVGEATEEAIKKELEKLSTPKKTIVRKCFTNRSKVPVRQYANTKSDIIARIPKADTELELTGEKVTFPNGKLWYQIKYDDVLGCLGWVHEMNVDFRDVEV